MQPADPSLGYLGPTLRAKVGDTIKIVFKNMCGFTTSLHPHGVLYAKDSEGAAYNDGTSGELNSCWLSLPLSGLQGCLCCKDPKGDTLMWFAIEGQEGQDRQARHDLGGCLLLPLGGLISCDKNLRQRGRKRLKTYSTITRAESKNAMERSGVSKCTCRLQQE